MAKRNFCSSFSSFAKRQKDKKISRDKSPDGINLHLDWGAIALLLISAIFVLNQFVEISPIQAASDWLGLYPEARGTVVERAKDGETQIHFIDVGQGDATLIVQDGSYALIDAGPASGTDDLLYYLHSLELETIEVLVMTHSHADHIGGMDEVIEEFSVETIVLPQFDLVQNFPTDENLASLLAAIAESEAAVCVAEVGAQYPVGEGVLQVVSAGVETENLNNISVSTLFTVGDFRVLNTGDAEAVQEQDMLDSGVPLKATVFQAGHHGSSTSNTEVFLQAVQPEFVLISCEADNRYGHPNKRVLDTLMAMDITVYRTDLSGTVVVCYTDQEGCAVHCAKDAA